MRTLGPVGLLLVGQTPILLRDAVPESAAAYGLYMLAMARFRRVQVHGPG